VAKPKVKHPSRLYNPDIANAFFRSGLKESWGRGTIKIFNEAKAAKIPVQFSDMRITVFMSFLIL